MGTKLASCVSTVIILAIFSSTGVISGSLERNGKVVVCYIGTWAVYRPSRGSFSIDQLDPTLCTHLVYSFAGLNTTTWSITSLDPYNDLEDNYGKGNYKQMTRLRSLHPELKITLAVGGWNEGSANYSIMASDPGKRASFITSALHFLKKYDFDGLDLDWEFPTKRGGRPEDKENFVLLIKELKQAFQKQGYILTAAISASLEILEKGYYLNQIHQYLDLVHLMCYDYHGSWELSTGPNAPLGPLTDPLTVEASVKFVLSHGIPREKLVMGLPLYGRTFLLRSSNKTSGHFGEASVQNGGFQGQFTKADGFLGYNEICNELKTGEWEEHWDEVSSTPWASSGNKIISYDDPKSIKLKVLFAMEQGLAGVLTWSMDTDDFRGDCSFQGDPLPNYPLLRAINTAIAQANVLPKPGLASHTQAKEGLLFSIALLYIVNQFIY